MLVNENVNIMGKDVVISYDNQIPGNRELAISEHVLQLAKTMTRDCGAQVAGIETMTKTCTKTSAFVGELITLKASGSGGTAPYTISFKKGGVEIQKFTGVAEGVQNNVVTPVLASDVGTIVVYSVDITDSCPGGPKTCTETCSVTVAACPLPTCNFIVQ